MSVKACFGKSKNNNKTVCLCLSHDQGFIQGCQGFILKKIEQEMPLGQLSCVCPDKTAS